MARSANRVATSAGSFAKSGSVLGSAGIKVMPHSTVGVWAFGGTTVAVGGAGGWKSRLYGFTRLPPSPAAAPDPKVNPVAEILASRPAPRQAEQGPRGRQLTNTAAFTRFMLHSSLLLEILSLDSMAVV